MGSAGASRMPNVGWKHIHAHQRGEASLLRVQKESWKQGYKGRGPYIGPISRMGTIKVVKLILIRQVKARSGWWVWEWKKEERDKSHLEGRFGWIDD